jgi:2-hydroxychromene-2-carboxylate isomerase
MIFYFDLGSPYAYLAAERIGTVLPGPFRFQPVSLGALFKLNGRSSWSLGDPRRRAEGIEEVERRARLYGLPPVRWPEPWPGNYLMAMRVATYTDAVGRGREFATEAFRIAFQHGRDLSLAEHVLEAAQRAGLDPDAVEEASTGAEIKMKLREATDVAHARGVFGVPTVAIGDQLFWGDDRLDEAAAAVTAGSATD